MGQRYLRGFTAAEKTELWDRWQHGESLKAIGRAFGKPSSSIYFQLAPHGGIRPAPRRRSRLALTLAEREEISRGDDRPRSRRVGPRVCWCRPNSALMGVLGNPNGAVIAVRRSGMRVGLLPQPRRRSTGGRLVLGILVAESAVPA
jgi:hypothetical protein